MQTLIKCTHNLWTFWASWIHQQVHPEFNKLFTAVTKTQCTLLLLFYHRCLPATAAGCSRSSTALYCTQRWIRAIGQCAASIAKKSSCFMNASHACYTFIPQWLHPSAGRYLPARMHVWMLIFFACKHSHDTVCTGSVHKCVITFRKFWYPPTTFLVCTLWYPYGSLAWPAHPHGNADYGRSHTGMIEILSCVSLCITTYVLVCKNTFVLPCVSE